MIYISHWGFVDGNNSNLENNPDQIESLIKKNIDVEIDVSFLLFLLLLLLNFDFI
tara:strand:+ start:200 stop:364 length:165 start_codon:yes stop_codon:yes gene_type:complete